MEENTILDITTLLKTIFCFLFFPGYKYSMRQDHKIVRSMDMMDQKQEEVKRPTYYPLDPWGEKYVNINYTVDQGGQDIQEQDVARPPNHRWVSPLSKETATWHGLSRARAPTYGVCSGCFKSGPTGKECNECIGTLDRKGKTFRYVIMKVWNFGGTVQILDSITFAAMLGRGHETAKADRLYDNAPMNMVEGMNDSRFSAIVRYYSKAQNTNEQEEQEIMTIMKDDSKLRSIVREYVRREFPNKLEREVTTMLRGFHQMLEPDNKYHGPLV